nr:hypothetical protein [Tanacetum cinerariifolium]
DVKIEKIHTDDNLAGPFIKALAFPKHSELTRNIGLLEEAVDEPTNPTPIVEPSKAPRTFSEKVKSRMEEEQGKMFLESLEMLPMEK